MKKTTDQIAHDCGINASLLGAVVHNVRTPANQPEEQLHEVIGALYQRIENLEVDSDQLALFRDLCCEKCGHHAHPDEVCAFCENAELKRRIEKLEEDKREPVLNLNECWTCGCLTHCSSCPRCESNLVPETTQSADLEACRERIKKLEEKRDRLKETIQAMRTNATGLRNPDAFARPDLQPLRDASAQSMEFWALRIEDEAL